MIISMTANSALEISVRDVAWLWEEDSSSCKEFSDREATMLISKLFQKIIRSQPVMSEHLCFLREGPPCYRLSLSSKRSWCSFEPSCPLIFS